MHNHEPNDGDIPGVPGWASACQAAAWDAARALAIRFQDRSSTASQLHLVLDGLLPNGWDEEGGIRLSDEESGRRLRELCSIASAAAARLTISFGAAPATPTRTVSRRAEAAGPVFLQVAQERSSGSQASDVVLGC